MGVISDYVCVDFLMVLVTVVIGVVTYFKWSFKYWERRNFPYVEPAIPFGTMNNPFGDAVSFGEQCQKQYNQFKSKGHKHVGIFILVRPMYMVLHPEYVKNILTRDFDYFVDRGVYFNEKDDPLSAHLFSIEGTKWRNLRVKFTPTFTSGKMKMMFQTLVECGNQLKDLMDSISSKKEPANIKDVAARFTTDIIGSCAFGLDCNTCKEPNSEFRVYGKKIFNVTTAENLKGFISLSAPRLAKFFRFTTTNKDVSDFFLKVIKSTVEYRETNKVVRKDFMQLLIELKNNVKSIDGEEGKCLTIEELAAQAFVFFIAGYETSSTTTTFCLYELALNPNIQQKVRDEVNAVLEKHNGEITYESISDMKYMGQVVDETLRKYPPLPVLNRICIKDYKVPDTNLVIEKGTAVIIPILGLQRDAEYYPDPEKFVPERFSEENKNQITPFTYLPFGEGPRVCIGLRFGLMQTKVGLAVLLKNYKFSVNEKTKTPIKMDPLSFIMSTLGDIWLNAEKVNE